MSDQHARAASETQPAAGASGAEAREGAWIARPMTPDRVDEVADALADAFRDYPVMRYLIGDAGDDYDRRLRAMFHFGGRACVARGNPVLEIADGTRSVAVAVIFPPGDKPDPPEVEAVWAGVWNELGEEAHARSDRFAAAYQAFKIGTPHYHLSTIGVRPSHQGRGLARLLLEALHEMSRRDPVSTGVSLTTELARNLSLYEHFGYRVVGHARVSDALETWAFFRPEERPRESATAS